MQEWGRLQVGVFITVLAVAVCISTTARADKRVALVIGNGAYQNAPRLPNPPNDAHDVDAALKRTGFDTILAIDVDKTGMDDAEIRFARAARDADIAIFYYSGHAMQFNGINFLMPVDAKLTDEADLRRLARVDDLVADLQQAKNLRILVLDSCRDNPFAEDLKRSIGLSRGVSVQRGLAKIDNPQGMIVSYATQAGRTAEDGKGRNSPYTTAFLKNIETQEEIGTVFRRVADDVYQSTNKTQLPEISLSVIGEFYLRGKLQVKVDVPPAAAPQLDEAAQAWAATRDTTSRAVLEAFISRFGDTVYGDLARARLEEVKKSQVAAAPTAPALYPASTATDKFQLRSAVYGGNCPASSTPDPKYPQNGKNVLPYLLKYCPDGSLSCDFKIDHTKMGDPALGCFKDFVVKFSCPGASQETTLSLSPEASGKTLRIECPPPLASRRQ